MDLPRFGTFAHLSDNEAIPVYLRRTQRVEASYTLLRAMVWEQHFSMRSKPRLREFLTSPPLGTHYRLEQDAAGPIAFRLV